MCTVIKRNPNIITAQRNLEVWKICVAGVDEDEGKHHGMCSTQPYRPMGEVNALGILRKFAPDNAPESGRNLTDNLNRPLPPDKAQISVGAFHSFPSRAEALRYLRTVYHDRNTGDLRLVRCEIPKGARYVRGTYHDFDRRERVRCGMHQIGDDTAPDGKTRCGRHNWQNKAEGTACQKCFAAYPAVLSSEITLCEATPMDMRRRPKIAAQTPGPGKQ